MSGSSRGQGQEIFRVEVTDRGDGFEATTPPDPV